MSVTDRVIDNFKEKRNRLLNGLINSIPTPLKRFSNELLGVEQKKMYVVTSTTKGAKTQFSSYYFIYHPIIYAYNHPEKLKVKIFVYPLEETPEDFITRFMSYLLYITSNGKWRISPTDLNSTRNDKVLPEEVIKTLESDNYQKMLSFFESCLVFSNSTNPTGVYNECKQYAEENGIVHTKKKKIKDENGITREIDGFDYYEPNNPDEYRLIFVDHVSLITTERSMTLKQSIDKLSEYCVILRNRYGFSPVLIQQQAFENEGLDAIKLGKIRPTLSGLADSKYTARDANVVLGLFSPFKFEIPNFHGYDIKQLKDNVRFLEVIINRGGSPGGIVGLYFDGAVNFFKELPKPDEMSTFYEDLKRMRVKHLCVKIADNMTKNSIINNIKNKIKVWLKF